RRTCSEPIWPRIASSDEQESACKLHGACAVGISTCPLRLGCTLLKVFVSRQPLIGVRYDSSVTRSRMQPIIGHSRCRTCPTETGDELDRGASAQRQWRQMQALALASLFDCQRK